MTSGLVPTTMTTRLKPIFHLETIANISRFVCSIMSLYPKPYQDFLDTFVELTRLTLGHLSTKVRHGSAVKSQEIQYSGSDSPKLAWSSQHRSYERIYREKSQRLCLDLSSATGHP